MRFGPSPTTGRHQAQRGKAYRAVLIYRNRAGVEMSKVVTGPYVSVGFAKSAITAARKHLRRWPIRGIHLETSIEETNTNWRLVA